MKLTNLSIGAILLTLATQSHAGITGYLYVHNSRSESISVTVEKSDGSTSSYTVSGRSFKSINVNDASDGTTWLYAYDANNTEIKRESANGNYSSYNWYVD